jgi:hypothetical protein
VINLRVRMGEKPPAPSTARRSNEYSSTIGMRQQL